jgi:Protein of unknown function (DUF2628)
MHNLTDEEVRAFVGSKASYYLEKWRPPLAGAGDAGYSNSTGFNWAGFFLAGLWLPYRKMYRATLILWGTLLIATLVEDIIYVGFLGRPEAPGSLARFVSIIASLICGGFSNEWYLSHAEKTINEVREQGLTDDSYLNALASRGGTNIAASLGFLLLGGVAMVILVLLESMFIG